MRRRAFSGGCSDETAREGKPVFGDGLRRQEGRALYAPVVHAGRRDRLMRSRHAGGRLCAVPFCGTGAGRSVFGTRGGKLVMQKKDDLLEMDFPASHTKAWQGGDRRVSGVGAGRHAVLRDGRRQGAYLRQSEAVFGRRASAGRGNPGKCGINRRATKSALFGGSLKRFISRRLIWRKKDGCCVF